VIDGAGGPASPQSDLLDTPDAGPVAVRGGLIRVVGYVLGILLTVGAAAVLFRHLGVVDTGRYVTVLALINIVTGVTDIGLTTIGMRELAVRDEADKRRLMSNLLGLRLVLAVAGLLVVAGFGLLAGYGTTMVVGTLVAGISVIAISVQSTLGLALMVRLQMGWLTGLELTRQTVLVVGTVVLVAAGAGLMPFFAIQSVAAVVSLALTAWLVRRDVPLVPAFRRAEWRTLIREVLPFSVASIVAAVYFRAALIVLGLVSTATQTGYFGAAFRIMEVLLLVPNLMVGAAFPIFSRAARDDRERLAYGVDRVFQASLLVGAGVMVALLLGAPFAIDVVAGSSFEPAVAVLRIQAVALLLSFMATTLFYALLSLRMHRTILATACTVLVVNVALAATLGASSGARGAAVAILAAELAGFAFVMVVLARTHPEIVPSLRAVPRVALAAGLALLVGLVPGLPSVAAAVIGTLGYAGATLLLRAVPRELLDAVAPSVAAGTRRGSP
jgi:O-antigen/teichoic acid export membrane protein